MTVSVKKRVYLCAKCNRRLKDGQWVFSRHTGLRYCLPGPKGCWKGGTST